MQLRFRIPRLAHRLILIMLLLTVPTMLARVLFLYAIVATYMRAAAAEKISATANSLAATVEYWAADAARDLQFISQNSDLSNRDPARQRVLLRHISESYPQFTLVQTLDLHGMEVARSDTRPLGDYHDRQYFREVLAGAPLVRELIVSRP